MSSKLGLILSTVFVVFAFLVGCDLITLQYIYSDLDAKSVNITYLISKNPTIDAEFHSLIEQKFNVKFDCDFYGVPSFGEEINYKISHSFEPLMVFSESITVSISRMSIVGYYG